MYAIRSYYVAPSIEMAEASGLIPWLPPLIGFILGGLFLRLADFLTPHLHIGKDLKDAEGPKTT